MEINGQQARQFVVIKSWQAVLTLLAWLVFSVAQFVTVRTQAQETERRVLDLENKKVDQKQYDELRDDIIRRLNRIESKVDAERRR